MQTRSFRKTFETGFYIEWEKPKDRLWSAYIHGDSSIAGRIAYDAEDYKIFREGWKVQESTMDLSGCKVEVLDPAENDTTYTPDTLPDEIRDYLEDAMIEIVEKGESLF